MHGRTEACGKLTGDLHLTKMHRRRHFQHDFRSLVDSRSAAVLLGRTACQCRPTTTLSLFLTPIA